MKNLQPIDVDNFLRSLVGEFVDKPKVDELEVKGELTPPTYSWNEYPFTKQARAEFIDYFSRTQENSKPRDISSKLNDVAFIAMKSAKRLIDSDCLQKANM